MDNATKQHWSRRRAEVPAPVPSENPLAEAMAQWPVLQANYAMVVDQLREADDLTQRLLLENESLRRENEHIRKTTHEQITTLQRERNLLAAYGTEIRTELTVIREVIENAERKAMQQAAQASAEIRNQQHDAEDAETVRIAESIARMNPRPTSGATLPPNSFR